MPKTPKKPPNPGTPIPPQNALRYWRAKGVRISAPKFAALSQAAHDYAFTVSGVNTLATLSVLRDQMTVAIAAGQTYEQWQYNAEKKLTTAIDNAAAELAAQTTPAKTRRAKNKLAAAEAARAQLPSPARLRTVYRNAIGGAYMDGRWTEINRAKTTLPYLQYNAIPDNRLRPEHKKLSGIVRRVDDPFWRDYYPPNGHNCRCDVTQLSEQDLTDQNITPTPPTAITKKTTAAAVPPAWRRPPGANQSALAAQTAMRAAEKTNPTEARTLWKEKRLRRKLPAIRKDIKEFIDSAAAGAAHNAAARTQSRITPLFHPSVKNRALAKITDGDIKTLVRDMTKKGATPTAARAELKTFFTQTIQTKPDTQTPDKLKWGYFEYLDRSPKKWRWNKTPT